MFGPKDKETTTETDENLGSIDLGMAGYFGGLKSVPDPQGVSVRLLDDRIEISFMKSNSMLEIPYRSITSVEIVTRNEFSSSLWSTYYGGFEVVTYAKINYQENLAEHYLIIDFDKSLKFALDILDKKTRNYRKGDSTDFMTN